MPEQRSPLKEFRHLDEKLKTVGLSPAEQGRYDQLKEIVSPEVAAPRPGFDVNAAAEALRASLEPAGPRRPGRPAAEAGPFDLAAEPALGAAPPAFDAEAPPFEGSLDPGPAGPGAAPAWDPAAGSYDQAAWDAGAAQPPLDPAAAFDMNAPPFDAAGPGEEQGGTWDPGAPAAGPTLEGAPDGYAPGVRAHDLGPAAFDAAALPPDPGPGGYGEAPWDAVAAGAPPEGEPIEAELVEAEPIEAEPLEPGPAQPPGAAAAGPDFFTPGPLTPDFAGAQPLDATAFDEAEPPPEPSGWPASEAQPAASSDPEPVPEATYRAPAEQVFEPVPVGGPGAFEAGEPPAALEPLPVEGQAGAAAGATEEPPVPLASASEFLSYLQSASPPVEPPAPPGDALDLGEVTVEELPPVEVDVEEILEPPEPEAPPPATGVAPPPMRAVVPPSPPGVPGPNVGGPSPTFVAGEHRVVVHTLEGQVLRGTVADVDLDAPDLPLGRGAGAAPERIAASRVKAIFFMLLPGGRPPAPVGHKVRVTFRDGRQVAGFSPDYDPEAVGFFMVPADSRTNTGRIWVYREAVRQVSVT